MGRSSNRQAPVNAPTLTTAEVAEVAVVVEEEDATACRSIVVVVAAATAGFR